MQKVHYILVLPSGLSVHEKPSTLSCSFKFLILSIILCIDGSCWGVVSSVKIYLLEVFVLVFQT